MTRQNKYVDGSRKRRHSADTAERTYYASHRQARFSRQFGAFPALATESRREGPQAVAEGRSLKIQGNLRPGQEALSEAPVDADKTR